ncbi:unnamed protein product [Alopecurus aequalis]
MLPVRIGTAVPALLPEGATALEIPADTDRPQLVNSFAGLGAVPAATAEHLVFRRSLRCRTGRPERGHVTMRLNWPEDAIYEQRFAYAHITPATAEPGAFIRRVFRTLALDLPQTFEVLPTDGDGDVAVRFRTPAEREAAMRRQPFELDGVTVRLSRDEDEVAVLPDAPDGRHRYMAHVSLHEYPIEQRTPDDIERHCRRFGFVREVDLACFAAPDFATVLVVLQLEHPREIPHEIVIEYYDGTTSRVLLQIVTVWDRSMSYDASGRYVRLFHDGSIDDLLNVRK